MMKKRFYQICLLAAMVLMLALSTHASTLDQIGAQVESLNFFEGPSGGIPLAERTYSKSYEKQSTRFLWFELNLKYPATGAVVDIPLTIQYLRADGSVYAQWNITSQIQPTWTRSWHSSGWGSNTSGNFEPGKFTVRISDSARQIATGSFSIYTDREAADIVFNWVESLVPGITHQSTVENNGTFSRYWPDIKWTCKTSGGNLSFIDNNGTVYDLGLVNYWLSVVEIWPSTSVVGEFPSGSAGGVVSTGNGFQILVERDTIPYKLDGTPANVKFTIETGVQPPAPIPQNLAQVGNIAKFGPDGFSFAWPVTEAIPVPNELTDLTNILFMQYYPDKGKWLPSPLMAYNLDGQRRVTSITNSVYELGYATLIQSNTPASLSAQSNTSNFLYPGEDDGSKANGAFLWTSNKCPRSSTSGGTLQGCAYYFVPISFTPKYPEQLDYWSNWQGAILRTGSDSTGHPAQETMFSLLQGTWEFCLTASEYTIPGSSLPIPGKWTYQKPVKVTINASSLNRLQSINGSFGWTNVGRIDDSNGDVVNDSANWKEPSELTACPENSNPTIPVGSGDFQATLTWSNTDSRKSDVDIHLYGPDSLHIYYENKIQSNLNLDRDWQSEIGNAVENIYSTGTMPKGNYKLTVQLYTGDSPTSYRVRVIQGGNVKTYEKTISDYREAGEQTIMEFTVN